MSFATLRESDALHSTSIIHFVDENWNAIHNICHSPLFPSVIAIIVEQNYRDTCERLRISIADGMILSAPIDVIAAMCTGGVAGCIYSWIAQDRKTDPSQIAEHVGTLVGNILNQNYKSLSHLVRPKKTKKIKKASNQAKT